MRHLMMHALELGRAAEMVAQIVGDALAEIVVGDARRHHQVDLVEADAGRVQASLDGIVRQIAIGRLDAEIALLLAQRDDAAVDGERYRRLVLVDGDAAVKAENNHVDQGS